jgi:hypothetical protein
MSEIAPQTTGLPASPASYTSISRTHLQSNVLHTGLIIPPFFFQDMFSHVCSALSPTLHPQRSCDVFQPLATHWARRVPDCLLIPHSLGLSVSLSCRCGYGLRRLACASYPLLCVILSSTVQVHA